MAFRGRAGGLVTAGGARTVVRVVLTVLLAAVSVAVARVLLLVDAPHAALVGCGVLAVGLLVALRRPAEPDDQEGSAQAPRHGRGDVDALAFSMLEHVTDVRKVVLDRVRVLADRRLAARGLTLDARQDAAAVERLLGPAAWAVLRPDRDGRVTAEALADTLHALERLDHRSAAEAADPTEPRRTAHAD